MWTDPTRPDSRERDLDPTDFGYRYYVYFLDYLNEPEVFGHNAGKTFYVGKGTKDRVLTYEKETRSILKSGRKMKLKHKHKVIIEIWDAGYDVIQQIVYRTDDEQEAYEIESRAIDEIGLEHLTNSTYGHRPCATRSPRQ